MASENIAVSNVTNQIQVDVAATISRLNTFATSFGQVQANLKTLTKKMDISGNEKVLVLRIAGIIGEMLQSIRLCVLSVAEMFIRMLRFGIAIEKDA